MNFKASVIADFLKGTIEGDPEITVNDISKIEEGKEGTLSFLANPKYEQYVYKSASSIIIVNKDFKPSQKISATLIRVENAYESFVSLLDLYEQSKPKKTGISKLSSIAESSSIGKEIYIGDFAVIGEKASLGDQVKIYPQVYIGDNVSIGEGTIIYPGVKIYSDCTIGKHCIIHAGAIIGADGFGFNPDEENRLKKIPQVGTVIIEDYVEIGASTTIDRATLGATIIRKGVKLDNLVMIAHNVEVGENSVIAGQSGIAGSSRVGRNCMFGGQVGLIDHIQIADGVKIAAQSGLTKDIKTEGEVLQGSAAFNFHHYQKCYALFRRLPDMRSQIIDLEKEVRSIKEKL